tara:strand:- start:717 stop:1124 length:408 start_codon:yes stop_codon:yes gene_type:complete
VNAKNYIKTLILGIFISLTFSIQAWASGLKVFGPEFCSSYDAGSCLNFHYKTLKDAKNFFGKYKYPKGKAAYDRCAAEISGTDGEYAYCIMLFHYAEQSDNERKQMCDIYVKNKYHNLASRSSFYLYLQVWKCGY